MVYKFIHACSHMWLHQNMWETRMVSTDIFSQVETKTQGG